MPLEVPPVLNEVGVTLRANLRSSDVLLQIPFCEIHTNRNFGNKAICNRFGVVLKLFLTDFRVYKMRYFTDIACSIFIFVPIIIIEAVFVKTLPPGFKYPVKILPLDRC